MLSTVAASKGKSKDYGVDSWIRLFVVSDPCRHQKGHTVYKVTSTLFPKNAPEAATQVCVWRRYKDFKQLHKTLSALHTNLHLGGTFPAFPKDRLFGRFEPEVIEERRKSAAELLQFVAQYSPLFTSHAFVRFFERGKDGDLKDATPTESAGRNDLVLTPIKVKEQKTTLLGGVWLFRRSKEDVSSAADTSDDDVDVDVDEENDRHDNFVRDKNSLASDLALLSLFDPYCPESKAAGSNKWLTTALTSDSTRVSELASDSINDDQSESLDADDDLVATDFPKAFADFSDDNDVTVCDVNYRCPERAHQVSRISQTTSKDEIGSGYLADSQRIHNQIDDAIIDSVHQMGFFYEDLLDFSTDSRQIDHKLSNAGAAAGRDRQGAAPHYEGDSSDDYLFDSAAVLKRAQESEIHGDFEEAFALYKTAIQILLTGATEDLDIERRELVKRKTVKYLCRAEEIYDTYLTRSQIYNTQQFNADATAATNRKCNVVLKSPVSGLGRYKVLGIIDKSLLVLDTLANLTCVIKVVHKSSKSGDGNREAERHVHLPAASHVVQLLSYHETDDAVFLVLEHAAGGRLWNYIGANSIQTNCPVVEPFELLKAGNVYEGKNYLAADVENSWDENRSMRIDTDRLVSKSRKLLKHVDAMLSRRISTSATSTPNSDSPSSSPIHINFRRHSDDVDGKFDSQQLQQQQHSKARKRSSSCGERASGGNAGTGSLELQRTRVRHFSAVFRDMDRAVGDNRINDGEGDKPLFDEATVRIWAAEIAAALMDLHSFGVVCRDLNPTNLLLDERGHILLTYFADLPGVDNVQLDVRAKEAFYIAPEILGVEIATKSPPSCADWFSFGGLLFTMLTGSTLSSCHPGGLWSLATLHIPRKISVEAESILRELLRPNASERLGGGPEGDAAVRGHPFFADVDWDALLDTRNGHGRSDQKSNFQSATEIT